MAGIIVHPSVDLDAVACIAAAGIGKVHFVAAGAKELPKVCACHGDALDGTERVLDHPLGEKGRLDGDGTHHAAVLAMPEADGWDPDLLDEIDEGDSTGLVKSPAFSLQRILAGLKAYAADLHQKAGGKPDFVAVDEAAIRLMKPVLDGLNLLYRRELEARKIAESTEIAIVAGIKIALPEGDAPIAVGELLNREYGVSAQAYQTGHDIGIFRYPGRQKPDLRKLAEKLPGWFVHTAGFLACWGSKKSPATTPPPAGTPQNVRELVKLLEETL